MNGDDVHEDEDPDTATLSKKFSFFEKGASDGKKKSEVRNVLCICLQIWMTLHPVLDWPCHFREASCSQGMQGKLCP